MKKITTILTLLFVCGTISYAEQTTSIYAHNYDYWQYFTEGDKVAYVAGVIAGAYALANDLEEHVRVPGMWELIKDRFPDLPVRDYVRLVDLLYEAERLRPVPIWLLIFRAKSSSEIWSN
jgi:hypothetical protein